MRVPEPPYPSFALIMLAEYPTLAPLLFPPPRAGYADSAFKSDTSSFTSYGEELRRSVEEDVVMYTVDYRGHDIPLVCCDGVSEGAVDVRGNEVMDEDGDDTFFQLQDALAVDRSRAPSRSLIRRRLSRLIVDLAAKVALKFKSRSSTMLNSSSSRTQ